MLVAINEEGRLYNLLENPVPQGSFSCPGCRSPVRYKSGQILRSHFAHVTLRDCHYFSENESAQHLSIKSQLYQWLREREEVELEVYLPAIGQLADLLVNGQLALEVQCSPLSMARLRERSQSYRQAGYQVLWLLGKDLWLKERLSQLHKQFLYFSQNMGFHLWEVDEERGELRLRYLIHEDMRGRVHCLTKCFAFGQGDLLGIFRLPFVKQRLSQLVCPMDGEISRYITQQLYYRSPKWLRRQEEAYLRGENLLTRTAADWYPQVQLPSSAIGFAQIERDLTAVYGAFEDFYQGVKDKSRQVLYPPAYYIKNE